MIIVILLQTKSQQGLQIIYCNSIPHPTANDTFCPRAVPMEASSWQLAEQTYTNPQGLGRTSFYYHVNRGPLSRKATVLLGPHHQHEHRERTNFQTISLKGVPLLQLPCCDSLALPACIIGLSRCSDLLVIDRK
jgi:hypothetical protein